VGSPFVGDHYDMDPTRPVVCLLPQPKKAKGEIVRRNDAQAALISGSICHHP